MATSAAPITYFIGGPLSCPLGAAVPRGPLGVRPLAPRQPASSHDYLPRESSPRAEGRAEVVPSTLPATGTRVGARAGNCVTVRMVS